MTTDNRTVTGFESRELLPVAGLGLGLAVLGAVVQRAETTGLGGRIVLGLVPVASIPPQLLLLGGLFVGAGGYALGVLWEDLPPA